jgi:anti-sigma regulatory factor (Ser/Thr protein kinase)
VARAEAQFAAGRDSVRAAREYVRAALASWDCGDLAEVAVLLTSELVTNAVVHAGTALRLAVSYDWPELVVEVSDGSELPVTEPGRRSSPVAPDVGGRGLLLVEFLAARWGVRRETSGKTVWFALRSGRPDPGTSPAGA